MLCCGLDALLKGRGRNEYASEEREEEKWKRIFPRYPESGLGDGYMKSVKFDSPEIPELLDIYGFVIVKVLDAKECDDAIESFLDDVQSENPKKLRVDLNDTETWDKDHWPSRWNSRTQFVRNRPSLTQKSFEIRMHPKIFFYFLPNIWNEESSMQFGFDQLYHGLE